MIYKFSRSHSQILSDDPARPSAECQLPPQRLEPLFVRRFPRWKRLLDIMGSVCGLIVLAPIFATIGIMIKIVSPGPVLFRQHRVGAGGNLFTCLKFRTMKVNADTKVHEKHIEKLIGSTTVGGQPGDPMEKLNRDSRVIFGGHLLRSAGLDELPQLINVLSGQMSLVGPRPPIPYEVAKYPHWYRARFDIVPGLTGLWQVSGKNRLGFNEMIRLDIKYAMNRSFFLDCKILLLTPFAVFRQLMDGFHGRYRPLGLSIANTILKRADSGVVNPEE